MLEPKIFDYVIHQFGKTEIDVCIQADEANSDICFLASRPRIIPYRCLYYKLEYTYLCLPENATKNPRGMQENNSNSSTLDTQSWFTRIMELAISPPIIINPY